ncbi:MAG: hypothetical protein OEV44_09930, partial [Spirochaetota bacterium]|nr:hypothetical protein [Spirochaetota bacterium]
MNMRILKLFIKQKIIYSFLLILIFSLCGCSNELLTKNEIEKLKEYTSLKEALEEPQNVYRLNLYKQELI